MTSITMYVLQYLKKKHLRISPFLSHFFGLNVAVYSEIDLRGNKQLESFLSVELNCMHDLQYKCIKYSKENQCNLCQQP
jgi:hypothetical protein